MACVARKRDLDAAAARGAMTIRREIGDLAALGTSILNVANVYDNLDRPDSSDSISVQWAWIPPASTRM